MENNADLKIEIPDCYVEHIFSKKPYQIWHGGRWSAKSWTKALGFLLQCRMETYFRLVYGRDTQKNVRKSQYQLFIDIAKKFGLYDEFNWSSTYMCITHKGTGYFMQGGSFEQPDSLRSVADVTDFWAEEPITRKSKISRDSFLDIAGSMRNSYGVVPRYHFTFNNIAKDNFIFEDWFSENKIYTDDDTNIVLTDMTMNPFCPSDRYEFAQKLKIVDPYRYNIDVLGYWGQSILDRPFFYNYPKEKLIKPIQVVPGYPINLFWDFNVEPMTCIVSQTDIYNFDYILKTYQFYDPFLNGRDAICQKIKSEFINPYNLTVSWVGGDASGYSRSALSEKANEEHYMKIRTFFNLENNQIVAPAHNESIAESQNKCAWYFAMAPNIVINSEGNEQLIYDLEAAEVGYNKKDNSIYIIKGGVGSDNMQNAGDALRYKVDALYSERFYAEYK